jgi:two-component system chemotaxis sensor kinase CheA
MDDLLKDFLVESAESIDTVEARLVQFEQDPSDKDILNSIFRLVHTMKGTCGFIGLTRLQRIAHVSESLIGKLRDQGSGDRTSVTLILSAIDRIHLILKSLEETGLEPEGDDEDLIDLIEIELTRGIQKPAASDQIHDAQPIAQPPHEQVQQEQPPHEQPQHTGPVTTKAQELSAVSSNGTKPKKQNGQAKRDSANKISAPAREATTIRVSIDVLERIMTLASELVLTRNQLLELARLLDEDNLSTTLQRLSAITSDLQQNVMQARMQPIGRLFENLPRLVRDLSLELGKQIDLVTLGSETEIDRQLIELIRDPILHLIRNCADHGLEMPMERLALGKSEKGTIKIQAGHDAGYITIVISDDGRGLNIEKIRSKAISSGLVSEGDAERLPEEELYKFIFAAGFSTAQQVTNVSGRGVGMDVVRENIESIGGSISLGSTTGKGTSFRLKIPLTLAIAPALIVYVCGQKFAIPQAAVIEAVSIWDDEGERIASVQGTKMLRLREQMVPLIELSTMIDLQPSEDDPDSKVHRLAILLRHGEGMFGILVDRVAETQEIVLKPLGSSMGQVSIFSGNTILGDGSVVLILSPNGLATEMGLDTTSQRGNRAFDQSVILPQEEKRLILFNAGSAVLKAIPLSLVSRIEAVEQSELINLDGECVLQHRGNLMPVIDLGKVLNTRTTGLHVLVIDVGGEPFGLLVEEIRDIVNSTIDIQVTGKTPSTIGSAMIENEATELIDLPYYMSKARPNAFSRGHARRLTVLLVDDKPFFRDMLTPVIAAAGYEVHSAASAQQILDYVQQGIAFDVLVTDIDMPGMNGYELAKTLHQDPNHRNLPIIALDAHPSEKVKAAALSAGMMNVVGKFDRHTLLQALSHVLQLKGHGSQSIEQSVINEAAA